MRESARRFSVSGRGSSALGPRSASCRSARSTSWARMRLVVSRAIGRRAPSAVASSAGEALPAKPAPVRSTSSFTASSTAFARRRRSRSRSLALSSSVDARVVQLQREVEQRRARHEPRAAVGRRDVVARPAAPRASPARRSARQHRQLVAVDDTRPVVRPRRGQRRVDAQPFGDRARRAGRACSEVANRVEREAAVAQLDDELAAARGARRGTPRRGRSSQASEVAPPIGTSGSCGSGGRCASASSSSP